MYRTTVLKHLGKNHLTHPLEFDTMWTLKDGEAYFWVEGAWLHECYYDFICGFKEFK